MSETTEVWVSAAQPSTATAAPIASTRPGRVIACENAPRARRPAPARTRAPARGTRETTGSEPSSSPAPRQAEPSAPRARRAAAGALRPGRAHQGQRGEARGQGAQERQHDARHQQDSEPPHHGNGREQQHQEADRGGDPRGGDGRASRGRRADRGLPRVAVGARALLLPARVQLDRVVDPQADQHRQHRDGGHGQRRSGQRHPAEGEPGGREGERQGEQASARPEDERERAGHHQERGEEQHADRAGERARQVVDHHRRPAHRVGALAQVEARHAHRGPDVGDRAVALRLGEVGSQSHLHERRARVGEEVGEAGLGGLGAARGVEDDRVDEVGVVQLEGGRTP